MTFVLLVYDLKDVPLKIGSTNQFTPLEDVYAKVKDAMISKGYTDKAHTTKSQLPNHCLIKDNATQQQAIIDLIEAAKKHDTVLNRYMAVTVTGSYQADASLL